MKIGSIDDVGQFKWKITGLINFTIVGNFFIALGDVHHLGNFDSYMRIVVTPNLDHPLKKTPKIQSVIKFTDFNIFTTQMHHYSLNFSLIMRFWPSLNFGERAKQKNEERKIGPKRQINFSLLSTQFNISTATFNIFRFFNGLTKELKIIYLLIGDLCFFN